MSRLPLAAALAATVVLAGCMEPEEPEANPLFGLCPQWFAGEGQTSGHVRLDAANATTRQVQEKLGPEDPAMRINGRAFDMLRLEVTESSVEGGAGTAVRLRATADLNGTTAGLNLWDFRPAPPQPSVPVVDFRPGVSGTGVIQVYLTTVTQDQPPRPAPVTLAWSLQGNGTADIKYTATYHYKVCGASVSGTSPA